MAPSAEALMRSRYSAFVRLEGDYLVETWHPSTRLTQIDFAPNQEWLLLRIVETQTDGDSATVEFVARSRVGGQSRVLHEISRFIREDGRWYYVDGTVR